VLALCGRWMTTMNNDHKVAVRRKAATKAWIRLDEGFSVKPCEVAGVSGRGVRLIVEEPHTVADYFILLMTRDGDPGRRCRIRRRRGMEIVAEFVGSAPARAGNGVRDPATPAGTPQGRLRPRD
jgi:hypothetical protein